MTAGVPHTFTEDEVVQIMRVVKPAFDIVRVVDPDTFDARLLKDSGCGLGEPCCCYQALGRGRRCANCISKRTVEEKRSLSKYDMVGEDICLVVTRYLEIDGKGYSLEMINRASDDFIATDFQIETNEPARGSTELNPITGLPSMVVFRSQVQAALLEPDGAVGECIVHFDLENFKAYNQEYGFNEGDSLLRFMARTIVAAFPECHIGHFGIDRFIVLAPLEGVEERVRALRHITHGSERREMDLKAGIYVITPETPDAGTACDAAKLACDSIKGLSDKEYRFFDDELAHLVRLESHICDNLDRALADGWVRVYYQPLVRASTQQVCAYEALTRWDDPQYGLLSPVEVIPVLERKHLIHKLDAYMIWSVCRRLGRLASDGDVLPVSVNLSRLDFELCDIFDVVESAVMACNVPRHLLHIEITESMLDADPAWLVPLLDKFRAAGYQVWMDDFGSGYSSLNFLKDYDLDVMKMDMAFLRGIEGNEKSRDIIESMVGMAQKISVGTVAEGVETAEQARFLASIGCEMLQGYYYGKPQPLED